MVRCFFLQVCSRLNRVNFVLGKFVMSRYGIELWTGQLVMTLVMNYSNYIDSLASPCNNALSCAVYIQTILNGITVVVQVLLIVYNRNHIVKCLGYLDEITKMAEEVFGRKSSTGSTRFPVLYNSIFTTFTIGRCLFMFIIKPKTALIQMVMIRPRHRSYLINPFNFSGSISVYRLANSDRKLNGDFNLHRRRSVQNPQR